MNTNLVIIAGVYRQTSGFDRKNVEKVIRRYSFVSSG